MPNGEADSLSIDPKSFVRFWQLGTNSNHTESTFAA